MAKHVLLTLLTICGPTLLGGVSIGDETFQNLDPAVDALQTAAGVYGTQFIEVPLDKRVAECELFVEGYRDGTVAFDSKKDSTASVRSDPAALVRLLKICVCLRQEEPPKYERSGQSQRLSRVPGTGTTRLGYSFTMVEENGGAGQEEKRLCHMHSLIFNRCKPV